MQPARSRVSDLAIVAGALALAFLLHVVAFWGVPLDSDTKPTYVMQVATSPELREATPYGLWVAMAYPMGPVEACREAYAAYARYNCVETTLMRAIATAAGSDPDLWRLIYFAFNGLSVTMFVLVARETRLPRALVALFALSLIGGPLDLWTDAKSAEPKATAFLLLAIWLALRARSQIGQAVAAVAMLLAALTKEPYAAAWIAVLGAALSRHVERSGLPLLAAARTAWRPLLPHALAMLVGGVYVAWLVLTVSPRANIVLPADLPYPPAGRAAVDYLWLVQPMILRPYVLPVLAAGALALLAIALHEPKTLAEAGRRFARVPFLMLLGGFVSAMVLHGLVYYLAGRLITDERYLVPGNYLACLVLGLASRPLLETATPWARRALWGMVGVAVVGAHLWRIWFSRGLRTGLLDEMTLVSLALAAFVGGVAWVVARAARAPRPALQATMAAVIAVLFLPHADTALSYAGSWRVYENGWQAYLDDVLQQAPRDGHVVIRAAGPGMIEHVWATEVYTLLNGRLDLTYHVDVGTPPYEEGAALAIHEYFVSAYNEGRRPLPTDREKILVIRAARTGTQRNVPRRLNGPSAVALLLRSPSAFFHNRYIEGKYTFWVYEMSHGG